MSELQGDRLFCATCGRWTPQATAKTERSHAFHCLTCDTVEVWDRETGDVRTRPAHPAGRPTA